MAAMSQTVEDEMNSRPVSSEEKKDACVDEMAGER